MTGALESTAAGREDDLAVLERIPLEDRGLPASTYDALVHAAETWPERPAISCLPDAEHWERPATRTFAELADDVHRFASVGGTTVAYLATLARDASPDGAVCDPPRAADLASYIHTGGTTGTPTLAARTHRNEVANAWMVARVFEDDDVVFAALPLFHTNAIVVTLLAPLLRGLPVVWAGPLGYRDPSLTGVFWKLVARHRIAVLSGVPTVYAALAGRAKDLIIRGGHNIDPAVIEDVLLAHPAVRAAAAVGRPDAHAGEVPVAYVVLAEGAATTADELRGWAAGRVPEPAAAPKRVDVIDAIPVTEVGKPFNPELRRRAAEDAARDALAGRATAISARLDDGQLVVTVQGAGEAVVHAALGPFALAWECG